MIASLFPVIFLCYRYSRQAKPCYWQDFNTNYGQTLLSRGSRSSHLIGLFYRWGRCRRVCREIEWQMTDLFKNAGQYAQSTGGNAVECPSVRRVRTHSTRDPRLYQAIQKFLYNFSQNSGKHPICIKGIVIYLHTEKLVARLKNQSIIESRNITTNLLE